MPAALDRSGEDQHVSVTHFVPCGSTIARRAAPQVLDRMADCGCGQLQSLGRGPKAQVLGHEKKAIQVRKGVALHW
jgi:hypothetical protein